MNKNSVAGGIFLAFSIAYIIMGELIPPSSFKAAAVGPRVFPIVIGILLALSSLALLIKGVLEAKGKIQVESVHANPLDETEEEEAQDPIRLLVILGILFVYFLLFFPLGYVLSTCLFIFSITTYLDREHWKRNTIYAVVFPVIVFLLFNNVLSVYLPTGPFS